MYGSFHTVLKGPWLLKGTGAQDLLWPGNYTSTEHKFSLEKSFLTIFMNKSAKP